MEKCNLKGLIRDMFYGGIGQQDIKKPSSISNGHY